MARKKTPADKFRERLDGLSDAIPEDLRLPSLEANRLEGYAYLFRIVLPLLNAKGKRVFTHGPFPGLLMPAPGPQIGQPNLSASRISHVCFPRDHPVCSLPSASSYPATR